jgi:hypothetical protein
MSAIEHICGTCRWWRPNTPGVDSLRLGTCSVPLPRWAHGAFGIVQGEHENRDCPTWSVPSPQNTDG